MTPIFHSAFELGSNSLFVTTQTLETIIIVSGPLTRPDADELSIILLHSFSHLHSSRVYRVCQCQGDALLASRHIVRTGVLLRDLSKHAP